MTSGSDFLRKMSLLRRKVRRIDEQRYRDICLVTCLRRTFLRNSDILRRKSEPEVISTRATDDDLDLIILIRFVGCQLCFWSTSKTNKQILLVCCGYCSGSLLTFKLQPQSRSFTQRRCPSVCLSPATRNAAGCWNLSRRPFRPHWLVTRWVAWVAWRGRTWVAWLRNGQRVGHAISGFCGRFSAVALPRNNLERVVRTLVPSA